LKTEVTQRIAVVTGANKGIGDAEESVRPHREPLQRTRAARRYGSDSLVDQVRTQMQRFSSSAAVHISAVDCFKTIVSVK
jgi:hypothetical protein